MSKLNTLEVAKGINENVSCLEKALEKVYRNKVFVIMKGDRIWSYQKTNRGAVGYIEKHNVSYYNDYTFEMDCASDGMYIVEVPSTMLVDINTDIKVWYNEARHFQKYYDMKTLLNKINRFELSEEVKNMINNYVTFVEENGNYVLPSIEMVSPDFKTEDKEINNTIESDKQNVESEEVTEIESVQNNTNDKELNATIDNGIAYKLNDEKNGIEIYFSEKPSEEVRNELKMNGFRWSRFSKCWYSKQSNKTIELAKRLSGENIQDNTVAEPVEFEEININDLDNYIISDSLSKAENNANWVFRTKETDHNKIVHDLFVDMNKEAMDVISALNSEYYIYKVKTLLQSTKKKYFNAYVSWLNAKISCPSWASTGRAGRSASRYEKGMSRIEKWEREKWAIVDNFNNKLEYYQYKEVKDKENKLQQEVNKAMETIDINDIQFTTKRINMEGTKFNAYGQLQCYIAGDYFICKLHGSFSIFNLTTKEEIHSMKSKDKLTDAKKYVAYLINKDQLQQAVI